jgi:membrane-bound lytic murein transglycosylase F
MPRIARRFRCLLIGLSLLAAGCGRIGPPEDTGELWVAVLDDPVFYQATLPGEDATGFEYDLLKAFAKSQRLKLHVLPARDPQQLRRFLEDGKVHFAATAPVSDSDGLRYTKPIHLAQPLIAQHAESLPVDDLDALAGRVVEVVGGTEAEASLGKLELPTPIIIRRAPANNGIDLLARIAQHQADLAASDSLHFDVAVNFYPDIDIAQDLPGKVAYAWAFRAEDQTLFAKAEVFLAEFKDNRSLDRLVDRYFGHIRRIDPLGASQFIEDMRTVLPRYRPLFLRAQAITGIDWRLLAALAYQESKWNPLATSYTGVRGIMMLTEDTADHLGVSNRLDPTQSILAGARYLADLSERLPIEVKEPDRLWLALAAYNLGMGHLNGARQFAPSLKRDPNSWYDMKKVLPLLARPEYYERLKSGRARGGEAVVMVENVRTYRDILARFESSRNLPLQTGLSMQ